MDWAFRLAVSQLVFASVDAGCGLCSGCMLEPRAGHVGADREELWGRRVALASVSIGVMLAVAKVWTGYLAHSDAVMSDGFESGGDVFSSAIVYAGLWLASKPPDKEHPYGHGRYETLAGLAVGAVLLLTGAALFWNGLTRANETHSLPRFAIYPLIAAVFAKIFLAMGKTAVGRRIKSLSLEADALHDLTDLLSTAIAILSVSLVFFDAKRFAWADRVGGMMIGVIIFFLSISVVRRVVDQLLDTMPESAQLEEIRKAALGVPGALGIEKCYARRTGLRYHVDLHLEVDPELSVRASHDIAAGVRSIIKERLRWVADVLVHVEPSRMSREEISDHGEKAWPAAIR